MGALLHKIVHDFSIFQVQFPNCNMIVVYEYIRFMLLIEHQGIHRQDEARLREVLRYASACGAITTTKKGAIPALPSHSQVLTLLNNDPHKKTLFGLSNCFPFIKKDSY